MQDEKIVSRIGEDAGFIWKDKEGYIYRCGYKPPTKLDAVFLLYLLYRSQKSGWQEEIELSRYEILKACGFKSLRPADYKRLEDSLERWKMVGVRYNGTFYDGRKYITLSFGIIDSWKIDESNKKLYIRFNKEWLIRIKNSTYFKYLDFNKVRSLRSPLAMRLYEILMKSFQNRDEWRIDAIKLAEKIPMKEKYPADIIPKIRSAVNRINEYTNLKIRLLVEKPKRGKAVLIFLKDGEVVRHLLKESILKLLPPGEERKKTLVSVIEEALRCHGEEYVKRNILYANEKVKKRSAYRVFLIKALKEDWARGWWEDRVVDESIFSSSEFDAEEEKRVRLLVEERLRNLSPFEESALRAQALSEIPEEFREDEALVKMQMRFILRRELESKGVNSPLLKGD